ncbi:ABC transporter permease [Clostridium saccharobutylicum]|uniref:ABC transporter permease n=1 Tax=Clostridium saccharobutylicum TaxID=169679 RepID=UPI00311A83F9
MKKMTFKELSIRMFKSNIRRYTLYFACSGFITMVLFLYLTLYTNKDFNNPYKVDSSISGNLFAPTLVLFIFATCFIIYAHNYFIKFRKKDFALFMIIGMTENDIRKIILLENIIIAIISVLVGLFLGTCLSKVFYFVVSQLANLKIDFSINLKSYLYTIVFLSLVNLIMILKSCIFIPLYQIINLLKAQHKADNNFSGNPFFGVLGVIFMLIPYIRVFDNRFSFSFFAVILINLIGLYLLISNLHWFIKKFFKSNSFDNLIWINNLKYSIGNSKKIIFSITALIASILYFISFSYSANESINNNIIIQNPYDLAYAEIYGKNEISEDTLNNTLKSNDVKVESINSLEIVVQGSTVMISDKSLNNLLGSNFNVERGKYICLLQINRNDGYVHNEQEIENYTINNTTYILQEKLEKILFNKIPILNNSHYLIFNQDDYKEIKSSVKSKYIGNVKFINFNDWTKTETVVNNLTDELENYNKINTKQFFGSTNDDRRQFKPVSKIIDYKLLKESSQFLTFLLCFVFILFFISSNLIIHFKLLTEFDNEKIKYEKLNKIGVLEKEISSNISKELSIIFLLPCILGTYLGTYCIYSKIASIGISNLHEIRYALITGVAYTVLELIFYLFYKKHYY